MHVGLPWYGEAGAIGSDGRRSGPGCCRLIGIGTALPPTRVPNSEIESFLDTSDEWIQTRTGIRERRVAEAGLTLVELASRAARAALQAAGVEASAVDAVICSSSSPDATFPSLACRVQAELALPHGPAFDIQAACSGAIYGMAVAQAMIQGGLCRTVLVVAAEIFSRVLDWNDRSTAVLFGDGAGALVVGGPDQAGAEILGLDLGADGGGAWALDTIRFQVAEADKDRPAPAYTTADRALDRVVHMDGREVFRFSTKILEQIVHRLSGAAGIQPDQISLIVPHQANSRILATAAGRLGLPSDRFSCNVDRLGNTSSASIPLALAEADREGRCHDGELICLVAFGAGLTWGGALLRWQPTGVIIDDRAELGETSNLPIAGAGTRSQDGEEASG
ncbi:MAG TPA: beta-ketoacyl-ACP synthase III [Candidatus Dormibacteraeota bacterium]